MALSPSNEGLLIIDGKGSLGIENSDQQTHRA
jgi:hypothetical protein